jgi:hypothetical protein
VASQQFHGHGLRFERLIRLHNPTAAPKTSLRQRQVWETLQGLLTTATRAPA